MNREYETWKTNYETEMEEHRKENVRIVYRYQSEYEYYLNNPDWVMYGDFCNFVRRTALNRGQEITTKYEAELIKNNNILIGFFLDEFDRIGVWMEKNPEIEAEKIFKYRNMKTRLEDLTPEQESLFRRAITEHLLRHEEDRGTLEKYWEIMGDN